MIGKAILAGEIVSKFAYAAAACFYIIRPHHAGKEKCVMWGGLNFLDAHTPAHMVEEMRALASLDTSTRNPFLHFVFSLPENEHFPRAILESIAESLLKSLGAEGLQALYGLHIDTYNEHLHLFLNRVDQVEGKARDINQRFYQKAAQRAAAEVRRQFNLPATPNSLYHVVDGRAVRICRPQPDGPDSPDAPERISPKPLPAWVHSWEKENQKEHPWRKAQRDFIEAVEKSSTYNELTVHLVEQGYYIQSVAGKKNAHVLTMRDHSVPIKLSAISRAVSQIT